MFDVEREWTVDGVVGYVFSLSFCAPDTVADPEAFEANLGDRLSVVGSGPFPQHSEVRVVAGTLPVEQGSGTGNR